jgi:hypothetical protein
MRVARSAPLMGLADILAAVSQASDRLSAWLDDHRFDPAAQAE